MAARSIKGAQGFRGSLCDFSQPTPCGVEDLKTGLLRLLRSKMISCM